MNWNSELAILEFHDPFSENLPETYPKKSLKSLEMAQRFDAIILSVPHDLYKELGIVSIRGMLKNEESVFFDIKGAFPNMRQVFVCKFAKIRVFKVRMLRR